MAITCIPDPETLIPPTETQPLRQRGGWTLRPHPRIGQDLGSDDDLLLLENNTLITWMVFHGFHHLGIIDPDELLAFHLCKRGSLSVRPHTTRQSVEFLTITLHYEVTLVNIYRRFIRESIEIYDLHAL